MKEKKKSTNLFKFVLVLLSASVERVGISRMRDFFYFFIFFLALGLKKMLKSFLAVVLLSASVEGFFVSRMRNFFFILVHRSRDALSPVFGIFI